MTNPEIPEAILAAHGGVMLVMSALLVYTLTSYARNVAYTEGVVLLALAFMSVSLVISLDFFFEMETLANAVRFSGACFALAGVWFFARDFVRVGTGSGYLSEGFDGGGEGGFDDGRDG